MLNLALSTLLSYDLFLTPFACASFSLPLCFTSLEVYTACSLIVSTIVLLYMYLSNFCLPPIGSFPRFHQGHEYISFCLSLFLSPNLSVSLFSSISLSFFLIFLRDNCVQALSSFSSLKRRLPSRQREAESAFQSSMMSQTPPTQPPTSKTLKHIINLLQLKKISSTDTKINSVLFFMEKIEKLCE